ncbi:hypothetical protein LEP1GSC080_2888 [Leptospira interrogans str. FPW2026]|nr:hypothetical protein LEP1GSC080_2888 [Leptospira interrogans str. FPW2026]
MGSKRITLAEYQKLDRKQRVEIFNQLEMSNRFELLKTIRAEITPKVESWFRKIVMLLEKVK